MYFIQVLVGVVGMLNNEVLSVRASSILSNLSSSCLCSQGPVFAALDDEHGFHVPTWASHSWATPGYKEWEPL